MHGDTVNFFLEYYNRIMLIGKYKTFIINEENQR